MRTIGRTLLTLNRSGLLLLAGALLLATFGRAPVTEAQEAPKPLQINQVIIAADGTSVQGYVSLYDAQGGPILGQADFDAQIDGQGVRLSSIRPILDETAGLDILMLIDVSGSMEGDKLTQARSAAVSFVNGLLPNDAVAVVPFAGNLPAVATFTKDHGVLISTIEGIGIGDAPGTGLYDAIVDGSQLLMNSPGQRRAVVLLTDGQDTGNISTHTRDQAFYAASVAQLPIYAIGLGEDADVEFLRKVAEDSQGRFYQAPTAADIQGIFDDLGQTLRSQYVLEVPLSKSTTANRTLVVSTSLDGTVISDEFAFLAPEAQVAAGSESGGGPPAYVWLLIPAAAAAIMLPLGARGWSRRRRRQRRGNVRGGQAGDAPVGSGARSQTDAAPALQGMLLVTSGPNAGESIPVGSSPVEIGFDPSCGLRIDEAGSSVAGVHARVWVQRKRLVVHHLARSAPTLLGGKPVEWASLEAGEAIAIGPHVIAFYIEGDQPPVVSQGARLT